MLRPDSKNNRLTYITKQKQLFIIKYDNHETNLDTIKKDGIKFCNTDDKVVV